jgi:hypothetical protein
VKWDLNPSLGLRWLDVFESSSTDLVSRVGAAVMLADKADSAYRGVLKMRGLPFTANVEDITQFFRGYGVVPQGIFITNGSDGRVTGESAIAMPCAHLVEAHRVLLVCCHGR